MNHQPYHNHAHATGWSRSRLILGIAVAAILIVGAGAASAVFTKKGPSSKPEVAMVAVPESQRSLVLYYNDGKTELWRSGQAPATAPAYVAYVQSQLVAKFGKDYEQYGAWQVTTSLDKDLQQSAVSSIKAQDKTYGRYKVSNAAFVAQDVTNGQLVAWVGSLGEAGVGEPSVTDMVRQRLKPGTLALPWTYAAYFDKTTNTPDTKLSDTQVAVPGWPCIDKARPTQGGNCLHNFDYKYLGPITARQALAGSRLVPAYNAVQATSIDATLATARALGSDGKCYGDAKLTAETECYGAATLGDGIYATPQAMLQTYATLANKGNDNAQSVLLQATLNGKSKYVWERPAAKRVIKTATAQAVTSILTDAAASYLPGPYKSVFTTTGNKPVGVAMGTVMDGTVASAVHYTDRYVAGFWITNDGQPIVGTPELITLPVVTDWLKTIK